MVEPWNPPVEFSPAEAKLIRLAKKQPLWGFLRQHRHELLNDEVRTALRAMYADSGRGAPVCPERLALALVLQVALHVSDQDVPVLTAADRLWRMVLGSLDEEEDAPLFSQGTVFNFRERAREHGLLDVLLARTVALARETRGYSHKKLRAMIDSSPLLGAGRVEDTFNLLGRAIARLVDVSARAAGRVPAEVAKELCVSVVNAKSVKAALDVDWRLERSRRDALNDLLEQFQRVHQWLREQLSAEVVSRPPVSDAIETVQQIVAQDTEPEPDPPEGAKHRRQIREGGSDRLISLSDRDMRHGRKSKTKLFTGYKRHVLTDGDVPGLVVSVHVAPANKREYDAAPPLLEAAERDGFEITELHSDRGYLPSSALHDRRAAGMRLVSKPPTQPSNTGRYTKADFTLDASAASVRCPGGKETRVVNNQAAFPRRGCQGCSHSARCLPAKGRRSLRLHEHEAFYRAMAAELANPEGRQQRRERVQVEHALARFGAVQGPRARFRGLEKNLFHAKAVAVVVNLYAVQRAMMAA